MKKQTGHVSLMFYTLIVSVKETDGKSSKSFRALFSTYIKKNQSSIIMRVWDLRRVTEIEVFPYVEAGILVIYIYLVISSNHICCFKRKR